MRGGNAFDSSVNLVYPIPPLIQRKRKSVGSDPFDSVPIPRSRNAQINSTQRHSHMLFLFLISLFFIWLVIRQVRSPEPIDGFNLGYIVVLLGLAVLSGWPAIDHWRFERFLSVQAYELTEHRPARVNCVTIFESVFDRFGLAGRANPETGNIVIQYPWCNTLRDYLDHPQSANEKELFSLHMFTHEAMHARGEYNEQKTDCQAIQRNYRAAKLLGVPDHVAKENAIAYYKGPYRKHSYFSNECAPGTELDERLPDSIWQRS